MVSRLRGGNAGGVHKDRTELAMLTVAPDRLVPASPSAAGPSQASMDRSGPSAAASPSSASPSPFAEMVHSLGREAERGEATVRGVLRGARGAELSSSELLALQAGIYRYGETIDLAAKLVDKVGTDVRTVLQGQQ
jgi:hypothetical protein